MQTEKRPQPSGFALIVAIVLVSLLFLITLSLTFIARDEARSGESYGDQMRARSQAMLALKEALGELQRTTGPDQRVTATGDLWGNAQAGTEFLVGVWSAEDTNGNDMAGGDTPNDNFLRWLVSTADRDDANALSYVDNAQPIAFVDNGGDSYYSAPDTHAVMVGSGSVYPSGEANEPMRGVVAEKRDVLDSRGETVGRYAWWVGDEGAKAKINIIDPVADPETPLDDLDDFRLAAGMSMPRLSGESITGFSFLQASDPTLQKMSNRASLEFLANDAAERQATKERFHDFTLYSYGVQSNTKDGGLKTDLSLLFEMSESEWRDSEFYSSSPTSYSGAPYVFGTYNTGADVSLLFSPSNGDYINGNQLNFTTVDGLGRIYGPTWDKLRDYYRTYREVDQRDSNPIVAARSYKPSTTEVDTGVNPSRQFGRSASRDSMRAWSGVRDPLLTKVRDISTNMNTGVNPINEEDGWLVNRLTASNRAPHLMRLTLQLCVDRTGDMVDYVLVPLVYLHNPYNIRLETENPSRVVLDIGNQGGRIYNTYNGEYIQYDGLRANGKPSGSRVDYQSFLSFTPDGVERVGDNNSLTPDDGRFMDAGFKFAIPAGEIFEPGEIRVYFPGPGLVEWTSDAAAELQLYSSSISMAKGMSGLVIHRENLQDTVSATLATKSVNLDADPDNDEVYDPSALLRSSFTIGNSKEVFMYTYELGSNSSPGNRSFDIVNAHKAHLFSRIEGFNWKRIPGESDLNALPGVLPTDSRTVVFTFDSYLKPLELLHPSEDNTVEASALGALSFPAFVASNPLSPGEDRYSAYRQGSGLFSPQRNAYMSSQSTRINPDTLMTGAVNADRGIWGDSISGGTTNNVSILDLPIHPLNSIGQLQHANLMDHPHYPALAIGNSFPSPFIGPSTRSNDQIFERFVVASSEGYQHGAPDGAEKAFVDLSYIANDTLWDGYYFSSIAPQKNDISYNDASASGDVTTTIDAFVDGNILLANPRVELVSLEEDPADTKAILGDYETSAARLMVDGGFNVNSTSVEAWRAFLGGLNGSEVLSYDGTIVAKHDVTHSAAFFRQALPPESASLQGDYLDQNTWQGYKALDADELDALAEAIVAQIRERASEMGGGPAEPFTSLGAFVNRMPESDDAQHRARGLVQQAIDTAGINDALLDDTVEQMATSQLDQDAMDTLFQTSWTGQGQNMYKSFRNSDFDLSAAASAPGYLLQSDVLQALAPYLSVRSDTFRIRTYGEAVDPKTGLTTGRAWLEAVVQRSPVPLDPDSDEETEPAAGSLGREYKIVQVNWLSEDQI